MTCVTRSPTPTWAVGLTGALVALVERVVASAVCSHRDSRFRANFKELSFHHRPLTLGVRPAHRNIREGVDTDNLYGGTIGCVEFASGYEWWGG
jgi:hypothetical protein